MRRFLALIFVTLMCGSVAAQGSTGHEFQVGSTGQLEIVHSYTIAQRYKSQRSSAASTVTLVVNRTVKEVSESGLATIEMRFDVVKVKSKELGGKSIDYDSTSPASVAKAKLNPQLKQLTELVGSVVTLKVTRRGSVVGAKSTRRRGFFGASSDWHEYFMQWPPATVELGGTWTTSYRVFRNYARMKVTNRHALVSVAGEQWTIKSRLSAEVDIIKPPALQAARVSITKAKGRQTSVVNPSKGRLESIDQSFDIDVTYSIGRGGRRLWLTQEITSTMRCRRLGPGKAPPEPVVPAAPETKPKPGPRPRPKPVVKKLDPLEAALIARHVKRLGTPSPNKKTDPEGWTAARKVRKKAAAALEEIGENALPALRKASQDPKNKTLRTWAAYVIRRIEKDRAGR